MKMLENELVVKYNELNILKMMKRRQKLSLGYISARSGLVQHFIGIVLPLLNLCLRSVGKAHRSVIQNLGSSF